MKSICSLCCLVVAALVFCPPTLAAPGTVLPGHEPDTAPSPPPASVEEARARARLLYEAFHGVLQVVHRDFFDPEERSRIPSASLEDVFDALSEARGVRLRWLGVNAKTLDVEHAPKNNFETSVVNAFSDGAQELEMSEPGRYYFAGAIPLRNSCLKCHLPHRTSLEERVAALVISMPLSN